MEQPRGADRSHNSRLPLRFHGVVVRGYRRGGTELGFPTANLNPECFKDKLTPQDLGVYYGWCQLRDDPIEPMVMSIGYNPQYGNKELSAEVHILKQYPEDFYGSELKVIAVGYIRDMRKFNSLEELILAIQEDIAFAKQELSKPEVVQHKNDALFTTHH